MLSLRNILIALCVYLAVEYSVFKAKSVTANRRRIAMSQHVDRRKMGAYLRKVRKRKAMNVREFATLLGVSRTSVNNYELGVNVPPVEYLSQIARLCDTTIDNILDVTSKTKEDTNA